MPQRVVSRLGLRLGARLVTPRVAADLLEAHRVLTQAAHEVALDLAEVEHLHPVPGERVRLVGRPVRADAHVPLGAELRERRHEDPADAGHEDALAGVGGVRRGRRRPTRHPAEVARTGKRHEQRPLAEVAPDVEPGQVTGDVVEVGEGSSQRVLRREVTAPRGRHPQREAHGRGQARTPRHRRVRRRGGLGGLVIGSSHERRPRLRRSHRSSRCLDAPRRRHVGGGGGERWVVLGANGAGKTTLLQVAAARLHPTSGVAGVLGEVLGAVDVFERGRASASRGSSMAERIPGDEARRQRRRHRLVRHHRPLARDVRPRRLRARHGACSRPSGPTTSPTVPTGR